MYKLKKYYFISTFILSIYMIFSVVIDIFHLIPSFLELNKKITLIILYIFGIELFVLFFTYKSKKQFLKDNWISLIAVFSSLSLIHIMNIVSWVGLAFGINVSYALKFLKSLKGFKAIKIAKTSKLAKTYKIGKKISKVKRVIK